jgi:hypothetical protein
MSTRKRLMANIAYVRYPVTVVLLMGVLLCLPDAFAQNTQTLRRPLLSGSVAMQLQLRARRQANLLTPLASVSNSASTLNMNATLPANYFTAATEVRALNNVGDAVGIIYEHLGSFQAASVPGVCPVCVLESERV